MARDGEHGLAGVGVAHLPVWLKLWLRCSGPVESRRVRQAPGSRLDSRGVYAAQNELTTSLPHGCRGGRLEHLSLLEVWYSLLARQPMLLSPTPLPGAPVAPF
eukprot:RCo045321